MPFRVVKTETTARANHVQIAIWYPEGYVHFWLTPEDAKLLSAGLQVEAERAAAHQPEFGG